MTQTLAREKKNAWQRRLRADFVAKHGYSMSAHYSDGGQREAVLARDCRACVRCGMSDEQHRERWRRPITVDHIDRDRSNNDLSNLQTLCLSCHGRKDLLPRLRERKMPDNMRLVVLYWRLTGRTYQSIADEFGVSVRCVWKWTKRWKGEMP